MEVLSRKDIGKYMNNKFVCKQMNAGNFFNYFRASNWGVSSVPTFVFFDSKHHIIYKSGGYMNADKFMKEVEKALKTANTTPEITPSGTITGVQKN